MPALFQTEHRGLTEQAMSGVRSDVELYCPFDSNKSRRRDTPVAFETSNAPAAPTVSILQRTKGERPARLIGSSARPLPIRRPRQQVEVRRRDQGGHAAVSSKCANRSVPLVHCRSLKLGVTATPEVSPREQRAASSKGHVPMKCHEPPQCPRVQSSSFGARAKRYDPPLFECTPFRPTPGGHLSKKPA